MTGSREWFVKLDETYTHTVRLGNDYRLKVKCMGEVRICIDGMTQVITNVYYIPELTSNLLSIGQLQEKGITFIMREGLCKAYHPQNGLIVTSKITRNRMFPVYAILKPYSPTCLQVIESDTNIWHKRFAHVNHKALRTMQYRRMVKGLPKVAGKTKVCETCAVGKQQRDVIPRKSNWRATERLQLIHTDLCGPITPSSQTGKCYVLVFINDYRRKTRVYTLSYKGEAFEVFTRFKAMAETEAGTKIKCLRSDRGGEFTSKELNEFCEVHGIKRHLTAAYTPQ